MPSASQISLRVCCSTFLLGSCQRFAFRRRRWASMVGRCPQLLHPVSPSEHPSCPFVALLYEFSSLPAELQPSSSATVRSSSRARRPPSREVQETHGLGSKGMNIEGKNILIVLIDYSKPTKESGESKKPSSTYVL